MPFPCQKMKISVGLALLLGLDLITAILFAVTKGGLDILGYWLPFLRVVGYQANIIVWVILAMAAGITVSVSRPYLMRLGMGKEAPWRWVAWILFLYLASAFPLGNYFKEGSLFYKNWMWYFSLGMIHLCMVWLLSLLIWVHYPALLDRGKTLAQAGHTFLQSDRITRGDYGFFAVILLWTWTSTVLVCFVVLNGIPHVQDSIAQLFQAKVFALGQMTSTLSTHWEYFERVYLIPDQGKFYSIFPPGHALVMAVGVKLGMTPYVVPFLSCVIVLLVFQLARMVFSLYVARLSVLFLALSPFFIFMGGGFMNHPTCLFFLLWALIFWLWALRPEKNGRTVFFAIMAGLAYGMAFLTRPQTSIAFLPLFVLWMGRERGWRPVPSILLCAVLFGLGSTPPALFWLAYNQATTGSAWVIGYQKNFRGVPLGLGQQNWEGRRTGVDQDRVVHHTPLRGFSNFLCNLNGLNFFLFGWPVPSLLFAFALFLPGLQRGFAERLFVLLILLVGGIYFFFFYQDFCFGPRFFYETTPFWIFLSARGLEEGFAWIQSRWPDRMDRVYAWGYGLLGAFFLFAFASVWVERVVVMSDSYWGTSSTVLHWARQRIPETDALIFVQTEEDQMGLYSVLDPRFDRGWIIAKHYSLEEDQKLMREYPGWPAYRIRYDNPLPPQPAGNVLEKIPPLVSVSE